MVKFKCSQCKKEKESNYSLKSHPKKRGKIICWECFYKNEGVFIK